MPDTWYAVLDGAGHLVSVGTTVADDATLAAAGYTKTTLASDPTGMVWDPGTGEFVAAPAPLASIPTWQFIGRFTPTEYAAIEASTDPQVRQFMTMLFTAAITQPGLTAVQNGIAYLVSMNLLTSDRAATIGAH
jgi:hypothetical protein